MPEAVGLNGEVVLVRSIVNAEHTNAEPLLRARLINLPRLRVSKVTRANTGLRSTNRVRGYGTVTHEYGQPVKQVLYIFH